MGTVTPSISVGSALSPVGIGVPRRFVRGSLAQEHDVRDDGRAFALERIGGKSDGAEEVGFGREVFADLRILFVLCGLVRYVVLHSFPTDLLVLHRFLRNISTFPSLNFRSP
jgi:hypothetical protein